MFTLKPKKCEICGKEFLPDGIRQKYCKNPHYRICPICGKSYVENNKAKFKLPPTTCSIECRFKKITQTSIERYGITAPGNNPGAREKSKKTMQERFGVDYAMQSETIREKSKQALIEKYGVDNAQKNEEIRQKTERTNIEKYGSKTYLSSEEGKKNIDAIMLNKYGTTVPLRNSKIREHWITTNIERYGVPNPAQNEEVKERSKETSLAKYGTPYPQSSDIVKQHVRETFIRNYGVDNCFKSKEIIEKIHKSFYERYGVNSVMEVQEIADKIRATNIKKYGVPYGIMLPKARKSSGAISGINRSISAKLSEANIPNQLEYTMGAQSYDIYIPQGNILLEIDPTYTHNTIGNHWNPNGLDKNYHLKKTINANNHGYRCIHLWDWDCVSKFIALLTNRHIIYKPVVPEIISSEEAKEFIKQYSLYDITDMLSSTVCIGLRYKTKLITIIGFKLVEPILKYWDIIFIENRFGYIVYNGNKNIINKFINDYHPNKIRAYADFSKTNGEILENMGFEYSYFNLPNRLWSKGRHAINDDPSIISEAMLEDKWLPIFNCGYKVYEYKQ